MAQTAVWFEAIGDGPGIIFPSRTRREHAELAEAFADRYRVVRYMPRHVTGLDAPDPADGDAEDWESWEETEDGPSFWGGKPIDEFPVDLEIRDLHRVADEAGVNRFLLAGYSGMGALASFLAPLTPRAAGLIMGGFPPLGPSEYWLGTAEGARLAYLTSGMRTHADQTFATALMHRALIARDDAAVLRRLTGPKIIWYGAEDGEPGCLLRETLPGARVARRIRSSRAVLDDVGFAVLEIPGLDHIGALTATDAIAARIRVTLGTATW